MLRDYLGDRMTSEILDELGHLAEQLKSIGWREVQPWNDFFSTFKIPQWNVKHVEQRLRSNYRHYRCNYLLVCMLVVLFQILFAPHILLVLIFIAVFYIYAFVILKRQIMIGEFVLNQKTKTIVCTVTSFIFMSLTGALEALLWAVVYSFILCGLHMLFRPRSVTSKSADSDDSMRMAGFSWFNGTPNNSSSSGLSGDLENPGGGVGGLDESEGVVGLSRFSGAGVTSASVRKRPPAASSSTAFSSMAGAAISSTLGTKLNKD